VSNDILKRLPEEVKPAEETNPSFLPDLSEDLSALAYRVKLNQVLKLEHELNEQISMLNHRKTFSHLIFWLSAFWLVFIAVFLWYMSCRKDVYGDPVKPVSDSVMIALITTTTVNVLGYFYIVAKWLFPQRPEDLK